MRIFIDESGDIGFSRHSSQYFVIAALIPHDELKIRRCFKRIRQHTMKKSVKQIPELKYNNTQPEVKRRIFKCFSETDIDIAYALLRKGGVPSHLRDKHQKMYNFLAASLVSKIVAHYQPTGPIEVVIDRSLNGIQREDFDEYLLYKMLNGSEMGVLSEDQIDISHVDSRSEPCIQAIDFIAGAIHEHYRDDGGAYYPFIKDQVVMDYDYFNDS